MQSADLTLSSGKVSTTLHNADLFFHVAPEKERKREILVSHLLALFVHYIYF